MLVKLENVPLKYLWFNIFFFLIRFLLHVNNRGFWQIGGFLMVCVRCEVSVASRCLQKLLLKLGVNPCFDELLRGGESNSEKSQKEFGDTAKMVQKRCKTALRDAEKTV